MPYQSVFRPDLFKGKTIIITGGGSGIGRCTAHELVALGADVAILGRTAEKLAEVKVEIEEDGGQVLTQVCDIRDETMVIAAIDAVLGAYGRIDGLVNNAGGQYRAPMKSISTKGFEAVVRSNLTCGFIFTETAACEWSASGVRVNAVAPGGIVSSGFDTYTPEMQKKLHDFTAGVPLQRFGTEAEISAAIVYLLSPAAAYVTGSCIRVDGGTPNARTTWKLEPHNRNAPFEGFHRSKLPEALKKAP